MPTALEKASPPDLLVLGKLASTVFGETFGRSGWEREKKSRSRSKSKSRNALWHGRAVRQDASDGVQVTRNGKHGVRETESNRVRNQ